MYVSQSISVSAEVRIQRVCFSRICYLKLTWDEAYDELSEGSIAEDHQRSKSAEVTSICEEKYQITNEVSERANTE